MATRLLNVEISEQLHDRLYRVVGTKLKGSKETYAKAMQSAVEVALSRFLDGLEEADKEGDSV